MPEHSTVLIIGIPGAPYQVTLTELPSGPWWVAAELCACQPGGHWHEAAAAGSWTQLVHDLLTLALTSEVNR